MSIEIIEQEFPEWKVEKVLGKGSYGTVYKVVRRDNENNAAAIKVISIPTDVSEINALRADGLDEGSTNTYFRNVADECVKEIDLVYSLKGLQNIVNIEDYKVVAKNGKIGWDIYIRMECLEPLSEHIRTRKLTEADVIRLGCDICTALEKCGSENIIHRDIKPDNIFINKFGDFKLGDFGIARRLEDVTGSMSQKGTVNYMAPEVVTSRKYDARVDIYSLGLVLYRLLNNNRLPFIETEKQLLSVNDRKAATDRRLGGERLPAPCEASAAMADVILRACAYNPDERFSDAGEMKSALERVENGSYKIESDNRDATVSIKKPQSTEAAAQTVRRPSAGSNKKSADEVKSFNETEKSIIPAVIVSVLAVVLLAAFIIFVMPESADNKSVKAGGTAEILTEETRMLTEESLIMTEGASENTAAAQEEIASNTGWSGILIDIAETAGAAETEISTVSEEGEAAKIESGSVRPVKLNALHVIDSSGFSENTGIYVDRYGNSYDGAYHFKNVGNSDAGSYAIFNLNRECTAFSGSIVTCEETGAEEQMLIQIFVDDDLKYTSPQFGKASEVFDFNVDVTGGSQLIIKAGLASGSSYNACFSLVNALVTKDPEAAEASENEQISITDPNAVSLNELFLIDADGAVENSDIYTDSFGYSYDGCLHFEDVGSVTGGSYAIFNLRKECTVFSGSIAACRDADSDEQMLIQIYVDDVLKYTSPQFGKTTGKIDFSVDVQGGQQLIIKARLVSGDYREANCAIVNGQVIRDPQAAENNAENESASAEESDTAGLEEMYLIDSQGFEVKQGAYTDSFGNSYNRAFHFKNVGDYSGNYAVFNIKKKYTTFSGSIVACNDAKSDVQMLIEIYVDGNLKYTSPQFGRATGKLDFDIDVTGAQKLTIKAKLISGSSYNACCSIVSARLTEDEEAADETVQVYERDDDAAGLELLTLTDSDSFSQKDEVFTDSFGDSYDRSFHFSWVGESYASYDLNGEYITFRGSIVACRDTGRDAQMQLEIYVDDKLVYTSPQFGKTTGRIDFEADIAGGKELLIKTGLISGSSYNACFSLVNAEAVKKTEADAKEAEADRTKSSDIAESAAAVSRYTLPQEGETVPAEAYEWIAEESAGMQNPFLYIVEHSISNHEEGQRDIYVLDAGDKTVMQATLDTYSEGNSINHGGAAYTFWNSPNGLCAVCSTYRQTYVSPGNYEPGGNYILDEDEIRACLETMGISESLVPYNNLEE